MKKNQKQLRLDNLRVTSFVTNIPQLSEDQLGKIQGMGTVVSCGCTGKVNSLSNDCQ